jgi:isopenicillin-N epimerase
MPTRREALGALMLPFACAPRRSDEPHVPPIAAGAPDALARDEHYWAEVARAFTIDRSSINLNNGAVSPAPAVVRQRLAAQWGVDAEELAITRSASEGLQICQMGFDLARGDEVLAMTQDYPRMLTTFQQRERRDEFQGLRVSPSLYTTLDELDRLCTVMEKVIRNGLPG